MSFLNLSQNLTRLRKEKKITQEELAEFVGVTKASVSKWETGVSHSERYHTKHNNTTLIRDLAHPKRTYRNPP